MVYRKDRSKEGNYGVADVNATIPPQTHYTARQFPEESLRKKKDITCEVIHVFADCMERTIKSQIRIVRWNDGPPVLEKRQFFMSKAGELLTGKCKTFTLADVQMLLKEQDKLIGFMTGALEPIPEPPSPEGGFDDELPF